MASLSQGKRIMKILPVELVNKALAEWLLVQCGYNVNGAASVTTRFLFNANDDLVSARVEVEIL